MSEPQLYNKPVVKLLADSRGAKIVREISRIDPDDIDFTVTYKRGAKLEDLWELAESQLLRYNTPDLIILFGGVCNLTDKVYTNNGERKFWPPQDIHSRMMEIVATMEIIVSNFNLINKSTKLCFIPEPGMDLLAYNRVILPIPWNMAAIQQKMENELRWLHDATRDINRRLGSNTPRTIEITHSKRHGRYIPVYSRLPDGLHPSNEIANRYAKTLLRYVRREWII